MRLYRYVGPARLLAAVAPGGVAPLRSAADLALWLDACVVAPGEPFTFVVDGDGWLRLAPRRSEHVACAGGAPVLAAGELHLERGGRGRVLARWASNQSTGYCPEPRSFEALREALRRVGVEPPCGYEPAFEFRLCEGCGQINLIKEQEFSCGACGAELPPPWNFAPP